MVETRLNEEKPKPKPVDIMDASWAGKTRPPGDKQAAPKKDPAEREQSAAKPDPIPKNEKTPASQMAAPAQEMAAPIPARNQPQENTRPPQTQQQTTSPVAAKPILAAAPLLPLADSFTPATNPQSWRTAQNTWAEDPFFEEQGRLRENAMTAGLIDNGFTALKVTATQAIPGEEHKLRGNDATREQKEKEEREKNRRLIELYELTLLSAKLDQTIVDLDHSIEEATQQRQALQSDLASTRSKIASTGTSITETGQSIQTLRTEIRSGKDRKQAYLNHHYQLITEYSLKSEEDKKKFGTDEAGAVNSDPQDEILKKAAWDENRDSVKALYESRGLGKEFETLEKLRNGETVDQKVLSDAAEKIRGQRLPIDLDQAMLKIDPNNAYFKTTDGLRVQIRASVDKVNIASTHLATKEKQLTQEIEKLETLKAQFESLKSKEQLTEDKIKKFDQYIETMKEQRTRAEELKAKIDDPKFKQDFAAGKISKEESSALYKQYEQLQQDIRKTKNDFAQSNPEIFANAPRTGVAPAASSPSTPTSTGYAGRTTTDSVAGIAPDSSLAGENGRAKKAFATAASGPTSTPEPTQTAQMDATLSTTPQRPIVAAVLSA